MNRPAIFFDRDNTLIACDEYLGDPAKVILVPGAADAVARARELGYATVVFSNQSGVARGFFDEKAVHAVNQRMDELLAEENPDAVIDRHEFCPAHPGGTIEAYRQETDRRKPGPGMIRSAAEALGLDLSRSWVIGDAPRDIEAGAAAGCSTILVCDPRLSQSPAAIEVQKVNPDYCVTTLNEALDYIEQSSRQGEGEALAEPSPDPTATILPAAAPDTIKADAGLTPVLESRDSLPASLSQSGSAGASPSHTDSPSRAVSTEQLETIASEILRELRRRDEQAADDFSVSKLLAGIVQVTVLAVLFLAYLYRNDGRLLPMLVFALTLQTMTIALLIMGRQR